MNDQKKTLRQIQRKKWQHTSKETGGSSGSLIPTSSSPLPPADRGLDILNIVNILNIFNIFTIVGFCRFCSKEFCSTYHFPSVRTSVTGVTSHFFIIIWWFRAWKSYIFWQHIIQADHPDHLDHRYHRNCLDHLDHSGQWPSWTL